MVLLHKVIISHGYLEFLLVDVKYFAVNFNSFLVKDEKTIKLANDTTNPLHYKNNPSD